MASPGLISRIIRTRGVLTSCLVLSAILCVYIFYSSYYLPLDATEAINSGEATSHRCAWTSEDPVLYTIKTHLEVNYDAGHWFHMSENILTYHSMLRTRHTPADILGANTAYFLFDNPSFPAKLNAMTRLITYLGVINGSSHITTARYFGNSQIYTHLSQQHLKVGDTFTYIPDHHVKHSSAQDQWISLNSSVPISQRFLSLTPPTYPHSRG
ncbi:hypothetical protein EON65_20525, partial [archaeon]